MTLLNKEFGGGSNGKPTLGSDSYMTHVFSQYLTFVFSLVMRGLRQAQDALKLEKLVCHGAFWDCQFDMQCVYMVNHLQKIMPRSSIPFAFIPAPIFCQPSETVR